MSTFSATDTAFTGFRIARERPLTVLTWAGVSVVISVVMLLVLVPTMGPFLTEMNAYKPEPNGDPRVAAQLFAKMAPFMLSVFLYCWVYYAILYALVNRVVLQPDASGRAYLRLGKDELRQMGLMALWWLISMGAYVAFVIAAVLITLVVVAIGVATQAHGGAGLGLAGLVVVVGIGVMAGLVFVAVRFSLCSAQTFATGKINLFGSWALTRGRFWPMLGTYLLSFGLAAVVYLLAMVVFAALGALLGGGLTAIGRVMFHPDSRSLATYFSPLQIAYQLFASVVSVLVFLIALTPAPEIYRQIVEAPTAQA